MQHRIVFLDRGSIVADIRRPAFAHQWTDFAQTRPQDLPARIAKASILIGSPRNVVN